MKNSIKRGRMKFYFPEFPTHHLNGSYAASTGAKIDSNDSLDVYDTITTFESTLHNKNTSSGYWTDEFEIKPEDFDAKKVLVKLWYSEDFPLETEFFYLINKNK